MMMLVLVLGTFITFSSCGNDEDDEDEIIKPEEQSRLVGKWKYSWEDKGEEGYGLLTFKSDGTGTYFEYDNGEIEADNVPFYWSYEETGFILTLMWIEDGHVEGKEIVRLTWINQKTFTADLMDDGSVWVKQ